MRKRIVALIIVIAVGAGGFFVYKKFFAVKKPATAQAGQVYVVSLSEIMGDDSSYTPDVFMGVVEGQETSSVTKNNDRELDQIFVVEGDVVKEGTPLFSYKTDSFADENTQLGFDIEAENINISDDNRQIEKLKDEISKIKGESDEDKKKIEDLNDQIDDLNTEIAISQNTIDQTNAKIEDNNKKINNAVVKSNVAGTITKVADDTNPYTTDGSFITILSSNELRVKGEVSEMNASAIHEGEPVTLRSRVDKEQTWSGTILGLDTENNEDEDSDNNFGMQNATNASKYPFYISLENTEGLMMGQHLYVELGQTDAPKIDFSKGTYINDYYIAYDKEDNPFVWIDKDGTLAKQPIELGEYYEEQMVYEVKGIDYDTLIAFPMDDFKEGMETVSQTEEQ
ncbi:MAG: efflux RND transporter periplasmic adaptor subunit [Pseudobutyrivibrio sp.]|nr:efflux RND transporter periplasmic adaptor subunit [Pseudobutyrivibrio sp.]